MREPIEDLWNWSVSTYGAAGVKDALLALQDQFGAHVPLLLWAGHEASRGKRVSNADALEAKRKLADLSGHTRAMRDARRRLPMETMGLPQTLVDNARTAIGEAELAMERLELARLAGRESPADSTDRGGLLSGNLASALSAVGIDLNRAPAKAALDGLVGAMERTFTA